MEKEIQTILENSELGIFCTPRLHPNVYANAAAAIARLVEERVAEKERKLVIAAKLLAVSKSALNEKNAQLADKEMAIGVLEATIETRKDIEAGHLATIAQMRDALEATRDYIECGIIELPEDAKDWLLGKIKKALPSAPRVVWQGKGHIIHQRAGFTGERTWINLGDERGLAELTSEGFHGKHHGLAAVTVTLDEGGKDGF